MTDHNRSQAMIHNRGDVLRLVDSLNGRRKMGIRRVSESYGEAQFVCPMQPCPNPVGCLSFTVCFRISAPVPCNLPPNVDGSPPPMGGTVTK